MKRRISALWQSRKCYRRADWHGVRRCTGFKASAISIAAMVIGLRLCKLTAARQNYPGESRAPAGGRFRRAAARTTIGRIIAGGLTDVFGQQVCRRQSARRAPPAISARKIAAPARADRWLCRAAGQNMGHRSQRESLFAILPMTSRANFRNRHAIRIGPPAVVVVHSVVAGEVHRRTRQGWAKAKPGANQLLRRAVPARRLFVRRGIVQKAQGPASDLLHVALSRRRRSV